MPNRNGRRKTKKEVRAYRQSTKSAPGALESTTDIRGSNLIGSDELHVPDISDETSKKAPLSWRIRIKRFIKKNVIEVILGVVVTILATLVCWYGATLFNLKVDYAIFETKLDAISGQIESLNTDNVTRELLNIQLEALTQEMEYMQEVNRIGIENRIVLLEQQITYILENAQKESQQNACE